MPATGLAVPLGHGAPEGFTPPSLNPAGVRLERREVAPGVYALVSTKPPVDNSSFVVGERGVLVVDANINGAQARQIQEHVREVTDKPILFLALTNYHGDHTFGSYAFPAETLLVAQRQTAELMRHLEREKAFLLNCVGDDPSVYGDVQLRLPDIAFEEYLRLDLGGKVVELHHFGPASTPGDTILYEPESKTAWTGNVISGGTYSYPLFLEGRSEDWLTTMARAAARLDIETIIPGHGPLTTAHAFGRAMAYVNDLIEMVRKAIRDGKSLEEMVAEARVPPQYEPPPGEWSTVRVPGTFRWNAMLTYRELAGE